MAEKADKQWPENVLPLLITGGVIAAVISVVGQIAGTMIPIVMGPEDVSDFYIKLDPAYQLIEIQPNPVPIEEMKKSSATTGITIEDLHKHLRPYKYPIFLQALGDLNNTSVLFTKDKIMTQEVHAGDHLNAFFFTNISKPGYYPVTIQGIGNEGKKRNATFYLWIVTHKDKLRANNNSLRWPLTSIHKS